MRPDLSVCEHDRWEYDASIVRVIDGDTIEVSISRSVSVDFGFKVTNTLSTEFVMRVRLLGIDTPEISGVKKASEEYRRGKEAKDFVLNWLRECENDSRGYPVVRIRTHDGKRIDAHPGKYHGRWVAEVWDKVGPDATPRSLIDDLRNAGYDKLNS